MSELFQAFLLGNSAILTNVCILPLYPGLIAFLAGTSRSDERRIATRWLGVLVLAGVLSLMVGLGALLFGLQRSTSTILPVLLPAIYAIVIGLGIMMLLGNNPFSRLGTPQSPALSNPYVGAYVYGLLLGPMTLPCTGPVIVSAFVLGAGSVSSLGTELLYFLAFGLGFGWPLVLLPFLAAPLQQRLTRWLARRHTLLTRVSGALLVGIGLLGIYVDFLQ